MRIAFLDLNFTFRGTTRAILNYAEAINNYTEHRASVIVLARSQRISRDLAALYLCKGSPEVLIFTDIDDIARLTNQYYDCVYHVSGGRSIEEDQMLNLFEVPLLLHQVGYEKPRSDLDSTKFHCAYTSHWQSYFFSFNKAPVVPYIIKGESSLLRVEELRDKARRVFGLDDKKLVLGRHGGIDTWNLPFVTRVVMDTVRKRSDIGFIFMNTNPFDDHPSIKFIDGTASDSNLDLYFRCTDAMIHARWEGETFGLACAEFLVRKKPIITWSGSRERSHFWLADKSILTYNNQYDLASLLEYLSVEELAEKAKGICDFIIESHSPSVCIRQFVKVFLGS